MKSALWLFVLFTIVASSCDDNNSTSINSHQLIGAWSTEKIYFNGVDADQYMPLIGWNMNFDENKTYYRNYETGTWRAFGSALVLTMQTSGVKSRSRTYKLIAQSDDSFVLETKLTDWQYCCNFDAFSDNDVITIREVYKRDQ